MNKKEKEGTLQWRNRRTEHYSEEKEGRRNITVNKKEQGTLQ